jgi:hypothetical protein
VKKFTYEEGMLISIIVLIAFIFMSNMVISNKLKKIDNKIGQVVTFLRSGVCE